MGHVPCCAGLSACKCGACAPAYVIVAAVVAKDLAANSERTQGTRETLGKHGTRQTRAGQLVVPDFECQKELSGLVCMYVRARRREGVTGSDACGARG